MSHREKLEADYKDDVSMVQDFEDSGSVYPKVTPERIAKLMEAVKVKSHHVERTTTVIATAILTQKGFNFTLCHEHTNCVDPRNFNLEKGCFYAEQKALDTARDKLWELEGYRLFSSYASTGSLENT